MPSQCDPQLRHSDAAVPVRVALSLQLLAVTCLQDSQGEVVAEVEVAATCLAA